MIVIAAACVALVIVNAGVSIYCAMNGRLADAYLAMANFALFGFLVVGRAFG